MLGCWGEAAAGKMDGEGSGAGFDEGLCEVSKAAGWAARKSRIRRNYEERSDADTQGGRE